MKNKEKGINFFNPKINTDLDNINFNLKHKLIKNSIKIYILVFILYIGYVTVSGVSLKFKINTLNNQILKMEETSTSNYLKTALLKQELLKQELTQYNNISNKKVSSKIIDDINLAKPTDVEIKEINWMEEGINIKCVSKNDKDNINFIEQLRKDEKLKNILYTGGSFSTIDNTFTFEINIIL